MSTLNCATNKSLATFLSSYLPNFSQCTTTLYVCMYKHIVCACTHIIYSYVSVVRVCVLTPRVYVNSGHLFCIDGVNGSPCLSVCVCASPVCLSALLFQTEFTESSESVECLAYWIPYTAVLSPQVLATAAFKYVHIIFNVPPVVVAVAVAGSSTQAVNITCLHGNLLVTAHIIHNAWLTNTLPHTHNTVCVLEALHSIDIEIYCDCNVNQSSSAKTKWVYGRRTSICWLSVRFVSVVCVDSRVTLCACVCVRLYTLCKIGTEKVA